MVYLVWPTVLKLSRRWWAPVAFMLLLIATDQLAERGMRRTFRASSLASRRSRRFSDRGPRPFRTRSNYGAYLLHVAAITAIDGLLPAGLRQAPVVFVLATAVTIVAASLAYRYFERPFFQLRDRSRAVMGLPRRIAHEQAAGVLVVTRDHRALDAFDVLYEMEDGRRSAGHAA